jgi:large subunit ribosomal protein L23
MDRNRAKRNLKSETKMKKENKTTPKTTKKTLTPKETKKPTQKELLQAHEIIKYPLISEKGVNTIETENKLTFIVEKNATKKEIKNAIETLHNIKVAEIKTLKDTKGRKKAIIKLTKEHKADEIATKLGVL